MTSGLLAVLGLTCKLNQLWAGTSTSLAQGKGSIWSRFNSASCWWQCQQLGDQFLANKAKQLCERNIWTSGGLRTHCLHKLSLHSGSALAALWSAVLPFSVRFARLYGGTHLASDRVVGQLTNMFPLGFKSHVGPNVTVDFFPFSLTNSLRTEREGNARWTRRGLATKLHRQLV